MATSKIPNNYAPGAVIANSTGNKTYSEHLAVLRSSYLSLNATQRQRCAIKIGDTIHYVQYITNAPIFASVFCITEGTATSLNIIRLNTNNPYYVGFNLKTTGITLGDNTNTLYDGTVSLVYI